MSTPGGGTPPRGSASFSRWNSSPGGTPYDTPRLSPPSGSGRPRRPRPGRSGESRDRSSQPTESPTARRSRDTPTRVVGNGSSAGGRQSSASGSAMSRRPLGSGYQSGPPVVMREVQSQSYGSTSGYQPSRFSSQNIAPSRAPSYRDQGANSFSYSQPATRANHWQHPGSGVPIPYRQDRPIEDPRNMGSSPESTTVHRGSAR